MPTISRFHLKRVLSLFIPLLIGLVVLVAPSGTGQAASVTRPHALPSGRSSSASGFTCGAWSVVPSPNPGSSGNGLNGVAVVSTSDVWAVGGYSSPTATYTLIEHWDGTSWSVVPSPSPGSRQNILYGVAAVSTSDVWAVGEYENFGSYDQTLIEHWDGTSWSVVPSPNVSPTNNILYGVAAVSTSDVWAVGVSGSAGLVAQETMIMQWNGTSWSVVSSPDPSSTNNILSDVAAVSAGNVWAVGYYTNSSGSLALTLTLHWDGTSWSVVASPNIGPKGNVLTSVVAVSASDVWAVGNASGRTPPSHTMTMHWNGEKWSLVASPDRSSTINVLYGVAAISTSDVWAVGKYENASSLIQTLTMHWNGEKWSLVASPNNSGYNVLTGVAADAAGDVWAVGSSGNSTVIEFYC